MRMRNLDADDRGGPSRMSRRDASQVLRRLFFVAYVLTGRVRPTEPESASRLLGGDVLANE